MHSKITVKICSGTACYVMGGASLLTLADELPEYLKEKVQIEGVMCMEYCKDASKGKIPFVMVNDQVISEATINKVIDYIISLKM